MAMQSTLLRHDQTGKVAADGASVCARPSREVDPRGLEGSAVFALA
jgi:hypothetical protein